MAHDATLVARIGYVRNPMPLVVRASDVLAAKMLGQRRGRFDLERQRRLE
jgi:hypothetical protein